MRFIRDIINENRSETAATETEPLILTDPRFPTPELADPRGAEEQLQSELDNVVDDVETGEAADLEAMMQSLEEEEAQREMSAGDSETQEDEELDTFDATGKADPFDKLNTAPSASKPPVSPLRSLRKTPQERLAASMPDTPPKPEATEDELQLDALTPLADAEPKDATPMPSPAQGRGSGKSGRVKTRLLGFSAGAIERKDPFEKAGSLGDQFPVGWLVVTSDKGRGASFALHDGVSKIGRGTDQTVCLDFGDNSISRDNHLSIAFDAEQNKFFVGHSGKSNLVRLNDKPLLSTEELKSKDAIRLGETTLRFIALCEGDFGWGMEADQVAQNA